MYAKLLILVSDTKNKTLHTSGSKLDSRTRLDNLEGPRTASSVKEEREKKKPCTRFFAVAETHYSPCERVLEGATWWCPRIASGTVEAQEEKNPKMELDHLKKIQCSVTLKRLMVHPDGWPFKKPANGRKALDEVQDYSDVVSKPLLYLETIKWKLEKGLYKKTDEFAGDIRILFCNAMLHYPKKHQVHKIAAKLSELFETKWKSLEEKWDAEKEKAKGGDEKRKPLERVKDVCVGVKACGSVTHKVGKKRKLSNEEKNMYLDSSTCRGSSKVSTLKKEKDLVQQRMTPSDPELPIGEAKKHFLDSILTSQSSLLCGKVDLERKKRMKSAEANYLFSCSVDLQRKNKEREAARMMLQRTERTVFIDDNLDSFEELERLCGCSLADCRMINPLKEILGLVLKDEFMLLSSSDEEKFLSRDWEEGEIVSFD